MERAVVSEKIWYLTGGRRIRVEFRNAPIPFVDMYSHEDEKGLASYLRIYSSEFGEVKKAIEDFADYMQAVHDAGYLGLADIKPSVKVCVDSSRFNRSEYDAFYIDCSRSFLWLLVRFRYCAVKVRTLRSVLEKERDFPIQLMFKVDDFGEMFDLLKKTEIFFINEKLRQKYTLPEKRLLSRFEGNEVESKKRRKFDAYSEVDSVECVNSVEGDG